MARAFTTTGDQVSPGSFALDAGKLISVTAWFKGPAGTSASICMLRNSANFRFGFTSTTSVIIAITATANANWTCASGVHGMTLTDWNHLAYTYDGTAGGNVPILYVNGVSAALTTNVASTGVMSTTAGVHRIGNNTAGTSPYGAGLAWVTVYSVILTPTEILEAKTNGVAATGGFFGYDLVGTSPEPDITGNARDGTVTGTTVIDGPPGVPPSAPPSLLTVRSGLSWG